MCEHHVHFTLSYVSKCNIVIKKIKFKLNLYDNENNQFNEYTEWCEYFRVLGRHSSYITVLFYYTQHNVCDMKNEKMNMIVRRTQWKPNYYVK